MGLAISLLLPTGQSNSAFHALTLQKRRKKVEQRSDETDVVFYFQDKESSQ